MKRGFVSIILLIAIGVFLLYYFEVDVRQYVSPEQIGEWVSWLREQTLALFDKIQELLQSIDK